MSDHATRVTHVFEELQRLFTKRMQASINYVALMKKLDDPNAYLVYVGPENPEDPETKQEPIEDITQRRLDEQLMQTCKETHDAAELSIKALLGVVVI